MVSLYKRVFPAMLKLACSTEQVRFLFSIGMTDYLVYEIDLLL